jgi:hypothetical protein
MQAGLYLTATRGFASPEARICYERAEPLCHSLNRPLVLFVVLIGQWRYALHTDKMSAAMQIAERIYSLAQELNDSAVMIEACRVLAATFYFLGDFESALQYGTHGVQLWRSGCVQSSVEEVMSPAVVGMCFGALAQWHFGEIAASRAALAGGILLAHQIPAARTSSLIAKDYLDPTVQGRARLDGI